MSNKTLIIFLFLLILLLLVTSCTPPKDKFLLETTSGKQNSESDIAPDETTETDTIPSETEEETWETVDPELIEKIRIPPNADENWLKREFPNIIDMNVQHRPSNQDFEPLYFTSVENYKTLNELIEILGKPHGCINKTANLYFVWITQEGHYQHAIALAPLDFPEDISHEEKYLHYFRMYIYPPISAPDTHTPALTTATPQTTREPIPGTTEEYVETTMEVGDWPWP